MGAESLLCFQSIHLNPEFWCIQGPLPFPLLPLSDLPCLDSYYFSELIFTASQAEFIPGVYSCAPQNVFLPPDGFGPSIVPAESASTPQPSPIPRYSFLLTFPWQLSCLSKSSCFPVRWFVLCQSPRLSGLSPRRGCWCSASILSGCWDVSVPSQF